MRLYPAFEQINEMGGSAAITRVRQDRSGHGLSSLKKPLFSE
jgi:hypothetical protein